jgi:glycosyltransferase involved in cell wall biosynthesis
MRRDDLSTPAPIVLSIVVPCYNEEAVLARACVRLGAVRERLVRAGKISDASEIVFVDDGSHDATWQLVEQCVAAGQPVSGVKLSRNCGHQNALLAGMQSARGDAVVTIDADLQDDEAAIEQMVDALHEGYEVVYGVRSRRDSDSWFKRSTAHGFYRLMSWLGVQTVHDHADYRLLSRRAVRHLLQFTEANLFLRGVVPLLGLRSTVVRYERRARLAGESKYPLGKMIEFALNGITSFSVRPLRLITALGFAMCLACLALAGWALVVRLASSDAVPGWASTILPIYFLGGVQLLGIGVLGEYIGKIYIETKKRPRFMIEQFAATPRDAGLRTGAHASRKGGGGRAVRSRHDANDACRNPDGVPAARGGMLHDSHRFTA